MQWLHRKLLTWNRYDLTALAAIFLMIVLRLSFSALGMPGTDSEEGTMGLMALHISQGKDWPIFYYGQNYMGAAEAYVGALMFRIFGVSLLSLRMGMILFLVVFMLGIYLLASLLYGKKVALFSLLLLSVGARFVITPEMRAVGGAVETLVFGTLAQALAAWLALTSIEEYAAARLPTWRRWLAYAGWGLVAGLDLWSHWLVIPFLFTSFLLLVYYCRREWLRSPALLFLLVGLIVGALPLIIYNLHAAPGQNSISVFLHEYHGSYPGVAPSGLLLVLKKLAGTFLYSLPMATGMSQVCTLDMLPFYGGQGAGVLPCAVLYGGWSLGYVALLATSIALTVRPLWKLWQVHRTSPASWPVDERRAQVVHMARLMLLLGGVLTILPYMLSMAAAQRPESMRYLVGLLIITPALLWPLLRPLLRYEHGHRRAGNALRRLFAAPIWQRIGLALLLLAFVGGFLFNLTVLPGATARQDDFYTLRDTLTRLKINHVYSGYWVCDRLTFASQERIVCGTILGNLQESSIERYPPYYQAVYADPNSAYVFTPPGAEFYAPFAEQVLAATHLYRRIEVAGFIIYYKVHPSP